MRLRLQLIFMLVHFTGKFLGVGIFIAYIMYFKDMRAANETAVVKGLGGFVFRPFYRQSKA